MHSILNTIMAMVSDQYKLTEQLYGHDSDLHFRAQNMINILVTMLGTILFFIAFFIISGEQFIDNRAKLAFGPLLFVLWITMFSCLKLVTHNKFKLSRNVFLTIASLTVWVAVAFTGGFPHSVALPVAFVPIVLFYCLLSGRVSSAFAIAYALSIGMLGAAQHYGLIDPPNYTSMSNPIVNTSVVYLTAVTTLILAFISFDGSVRHFSKRSKAAVESKAQFLANMSHEIRTPMNGVIGLSDVLAKTPLSPEQEKYVTAIQTSGEALLTIINDILDFSKIEAGKLELDVAPFNLEAVISDIGLLLSSKIEEKGLDFSVRYAPDLPREFNGDDGRIRQILLNLVGNAVKFTQNGSVKIQVLRSASGRTRIEVLDTGIGIADAHVGSIFDKFNQAETSTSRTFGGTGLGLAISQRLVQLMGGKIGVTSTLGTGSTFWFEVPLPEIKSAGPNGKDRRGAQKRRATDTREAPAEQPKQEPELQSDILFVSNSNDTIQSSRRAFFKSDKTVKYMGFSRALIEHLNALIHGGHPLPLMIFDTRSIAKSAKAFLDKIGNHKLFSNMQIIALVNPEDFDPNDSHLFPGNVERLACPYTEGSLLRKVSEITDSAAIDRAASVLPVLVKEEPEPEPSTPPVRTASPNLQILVAEDNRINMKVIQNILAADNFDVTYAYSGQQAVDSCKSAIFDIIILDMAMPVLSGSEAGKAIRSIEQTFGLNETPIIGLKPPQGSENGVNYENAGLTDYLPKPIRKDDLLAYISLYTEESQAQKAG